MQDLLGYSGPAGLCEGGCVSDPAVLAQLERPPLPAVSMFRMSVSGCSEGSCQPTQYMCHSVTSCISHMKPAVGDIPALLLHIPMHTGCHNGGE